MNKKNIFRLFLCIVMVLGLTGCLKKEKVTQDVFKNVVESYGLTIIDKSIEFPDEKLLSYLSATNNEYFIEYYELDSEENAKDIYNTNKNDIEAFKGSNYSQVDLNGLNYQLYKLTANGKYYFISRVENVIIYSEVKSNYKDKIKEITEDLGF